MARRSDNVLKGVERAPMRSLFYAMGYTKEELERPLIGVVSAHSEIVPGHMHLDKVTEAVKEKFEKRNYSVPNATLSFEQLLGRPEITVKFLEKFKEIPYDKEIKEQVEIYLKYKGYIEKSYKEAEKMLKLEKKQIPEDIDYDKVSNIASEARQKLKEVRPTTIAQAIRISGVNPSDISILSVYLKKEYAKDE